MIRGVRLFKKPVPFTCLLIICFIIANYCFELTRQDRVIASELANDPQKIIQNGEVYRLYTSFLTHANLGSLLLSVYLLLVEGGAFENLIGSLTYMMLFAVKGFLIQVFYVGWYYLVQQLFQPSTSSFNSISEGAWMVILSDLVSRTLACPNEKRICKSISNKIYIIPLFLISLGVSYIGVHLLAVVSLALIEHRLFNGMICRPKRSHILFLEDYTPIRLLKKCLQFSFVSVEECNISFFRIEKSDRFVEMHEESEDHSNDASEIMQDANEAKEDDLKAADSGRQLSETTENNNKKKNIQSNTRDVEDSFYGNSNDFGKIAVSQSYYSSNIEKWRHAEDQDENVADDCEDPQQRRDDIEMTTKAP